jgi:hypothetical protein
VKGKIRYYFGNQLSSEANSFKYLGIIIRSDINWERLRWSRGSVLAFGTQVRGFKPEKNPQHAFLRRGIKAVCLMSWKSSLSEKFLGHFSPIVPPSAAGFASVASDACESWNALNPWFSSKLGV